VEISFLFFFSSLKEDFWGENLGEIRNKEKMGHVGFQRERFHKTS